MDNCVIRSLVELASVVIVSTPFVLMHVNRLG